MNKLRTIRLALVCGLSASACVNDDNDISYGGEPVKASDNSDQYIPGGNIGGNVEGDGSLGGDGDGGSDGDTTDSTSTTEDVEGDPTYGSGLHSVIIQSTCVFAWDLEGPATDCSDCTYAFDVDLRFNSSLSDCSGGIDFSGVLAFRDGSAYLADDYVGQASYSSSEVRWATAGYISGAGGGFYAYDGYIVFE
ncbi:MAG TPA: hypothetical protein DFR83_25740 [Deltaproteobacteria bacterium]|nr:hypothetical protein [Deltaproteobacteria bacterium]